MRTLAVVVAVFALALPATASARARPDLVVKSGAVAVDGGTLTGSVRVRNKGRKRAGRSAVAFTVGFKDGGTIPVKAIKRKRSRRIKVSLPLPSGLAPGDHQITACADGRRRIKERSEANNCRKVGSVTVPDGSSPTPNPVPTATGGPAPSAPASSVPTDPIAYNKDEVIEPGNGRTYWTYVPQAYDDSHKTPMRLLVWLHGCQGNSSGDIYTVTKDDNSYLAITVDGRENGVGGSDGCWQPDQDQNKVLDAIANLKTHFNVDPRHVVIGGYSSGGDLAYRTAFYHSNTFAGLLAENTSPFRDTGSSADDSIAAAAWKFNIVHLAHRQDDTYDIDEVRGEIDQLKDADFPVTLVERDGGHGDDTTDPDLQSLLLPHMADNWRSP